ncbi:hypothetical protein A5658_12880 [Mycobacterium sp. 1245111.1]|uniref:hypothetical protein n=1 Tax=Mycobacterium sp. 1245111.1 TaxID=1834073 RepID=UPI0007FC8008|nr:hypothetical protein [Mycobacterium sp. 1245111.1]OBK33739.1 hypothetical protein A5658_12880 [Mycobacterium sp. 1245111.1]
MHFYSNRPTREKVCPVNDPAPSVRVGDVADISPITFGALGDWPDEKDVFWFEQADRSVHVSHCDNPRETGQGQYAGGLGDKFPRHIALT